MNGTARRYEWIQMQLRLDRGLGQHIVTAARAITGAGTWRRRLSARDLLA